MSRIAAISLFAVTVSFGVTATQFAFASSKERPVLYYSTELESSKGRMPACTPVTAKAGRRSVVLRDINKLWGKTTLPSAEFAKLIPHEGFDECVKLVDTYEGRYSDAHLLALSDGQLAATMPFEFALMILGPPSQSPTIVSMINPMTGKPETQKTFMWMKMYGNIGTLRTVFTIVGGAALGVAAASSSLNTAVDALSLANAASLANLALWNVTDFSRAKFVTIQVNSSNEIQMLMAQ